MAATPSRVPVKVEGAKEVRRAMNRLSDDVDRSNARGELRAVHLQLAKLVAARAVDIMPVQSGQLKATVRPAGTQAGGRVRVGFKRVPYAGPIHFGWFARRITPQPFLYEALDSRRGEVLDTYLESLNRLIREYRLD